MQPHVTDSAEFPGNPVLTIVHHNIQGLQSKMPDLMNNTDMKKDVVLLTETHLTPAVPNCRIALHNYNLKRKDRTQGPGGGVAMYISSSKTATNLDLPTGNLEALAVAIQEIPQTIVAVVYRPPSHILHSFGSDLTTMLTAIKSHQNVIIAGDFNENLLSDNSHPIQEIFSKFRFSQHIKKPTTRYGSILDAIYTRSVSFMDLQVGVIPTYYSDHEAIQIHISQ